VDHAALDDVSIGAGGSADGAATGSATGATTETIGATVVVVVVVGVTVDVVAAGATVGIVELGIAAETTTFAGVPGASALRTLSLGAPVTGA
jgi:hypothetical protein